MFLIVYSLHLICKGAHITLDLLPCSRTVVQAELPHSAIQFLSLASELWSRRLSVCSAIDNYRYTIRPICNREPILHCERLGERNSTRSHLPCSALCVFVHHTDKTRDLITALDVQISTFCSIFSRPIFRRFFFSFIFNRISSFGVSFFGFNCRILIVGNLFDVLDIFAGLLGQ